METKIRIGQTAGLGLLMVTWLSAAYAEQKEENLDMDMRPGLHLHANQTSSSVLAEAARTGGSVIISEDSLEDEYEPLQSQASVYTVRAGDTLWDICTRYFSDPYQWPKIWSYNTQITNPNWIYPGDVIWMSKPAPRSLLGTDDTDEPRQIIQAAVNQPPSVIIKNRGFIDKKTLEQSGLLVGSHKEVEMLGQYDEAYVEFEKNKNIKPGDEFAAFVILREVEAVDDPGTEMGKLVEILGQVTVTSFDPKTRIARVVVNESTTDIKRGTYIGPIKRKFNVVPAVSNAKDLEGQLIAILNPVRYAASHQIVFVDKGKEDGVREGNRFFAVERGDNWRKSNDEDDDREGYPKEVIAEIRVVETRPKTSTCLITGSIRELEVGQLVEMRKGY